MDEIKKAFESCEETKACAACEMLNEITDNFCGKCGVKLNVVCPNCWQLNKPFNCGLDTCNG